MRDEELEQARDDPDDNGGIRTAVRLVGEDPAAAKARYGPAASWDMSGVTQMRFVFAGIDRFDEDLSRWDVSNIWDWGFTFHGATAFSGRGLSRWDVSKVRDMQSMFGALADTTAFCEDLSSWDVSNVRHMMYMFDGATSFNCDISGWDTSNTVSMMYMFNRAESFNCDISGWDVSKVNSMNRMFDGAISFNHQLRGGFCNSTADMQETFRSCPGSIEGRTKLVDGSVLNVFEQIAHQWQAALGAAPG